MLFGESVTVARRGVDGATFDELGNPIPGSSSSFTVTGVAVAPLSPQESAELFGADSRGGFTLYLPPGSELLASDLVTVRGESGFQVEGAAALVQWRSPFTGWAAGSVAVVRRSS